MLWGGGERAWKHCQIHYRGTAFFPLRLPLEIGCDQRLSPHRHFSSSQNTGQWRPHTATAFTEPFSGDLPQRMRGGTKSTMNSDQNLRHSRRYSRQIS